MQTVRWSAGYIKVRPGTVQDELTSDRILTSVTAAYPSDALGLWRTFADLCAQTVTSDGLGFKPENVVALAPVQQKEAYEAFLKLPKALKRRWLEALAAADGVQDIAVGPEPLAADADPNS